MNEDVERLGPSPSGADILANVLISDKPEIMRLNELPEAIQVDICKARLMGFHPVSVRWLTGEFAILMCQPGTNWPDPTLIVRAFHGCRSGGAPFPEGDLSC